MTATMLPKLPAAAAFGGSAFPAGAAAALFFVVSVVTFLLFTEMGTRVAKTS